MLVSVKIRSQVFLRHLSNRLRTVPPIHPLYSRQIDHPVPYNFCKKEQNALNRQVRKI